MDLFLISLNFFTIIMYMKFHNTAQEIEDVSFALLIFIRNSSQLLRLVVLIKNQKTVKVINIVIFQKNVNDIINFNTLFEEKKFENLSLKKEKSNEVISFVDDDITKKSKHLHVIHLDFKDNDLD